MHNLEIGLLTSRLVRTCSIKRAIPSERTAIGKPCNGMPLIRLGAIALICKTINSEQFSNSFGLIMALHRVLTAAGKNGGRNGGTEEIRGKW